MMTRQHHHFPKAFLALLLLLPIACHAFPRPNWRKKALMTRWLAHEAAYGVLSTVGEGGAPVGGVVSVADSSAANGRLWLYLSPMDELTQNLKRDPRASLTLTQASLAADGCGQTDPEDPTCARASFLGTAVELPADSPDAQAARAALFARHPAMKGWPDDHAFSAWELVVREAHLLDFYGGMAVVAGDAYYSEEVPPPDEARKEEQTTTRRPGWPWGLRRRWRDPSSLSVAAAV